MTAIVREPGSARQPISAAGGRAPGDHPNGHHGPAESIVKWHAAAVLAWETHRNGGCGMVKPSFGDIGRAIDAMRAQRPAIDVNALHTGMMRLGLRWTLVTRDDIRRVLARRARAHARGNSPRFSVATGKKRDRNRAAGDFADHVILRMRAQQSRNSRFEAPRELCPGCGIRPSVLGGCKCSNWRYA
jgi:hypothetical protein